LAFLLLTGRFTHSSFNSGLVLGPGQLGPLGSPPLLGAREGTGRIRVCAHFGGNRGYWLKTGFPKPLITSRFKFFCSFPRVGIIGSQETLGFIQIGLGGEILPSFPGITRKPFQKLFLIPPFPNFPILIRSIPN